MLRYLIACGVIVLMVGGCASIQPGPGEQINAFAEFDGSRVHYRDAGHGRDAIVLVHGWASDTRAWKHQFPELADTYRVISVDLPGHGLSEPPANAYSMPMFADAIAAVLDESRVRRAVLIGHSNGVPVIASFYHRHPQRTLGLVAIDGALKQIFPREQSEQMFSMFSEDNWHEPMSMMIANMAGPGLTEEDRAMLDRMANDQTWAAVRGGFEAAIADDAFHAGEINVPVLAVMTAAPFWDEAYREFIAEIAPQSEYRVFEDTGHFVQFERPDALRAAIDAFMEQYDLLP